MWSLQAINYQARSYYSYRDVHMEISGADSGVPATASNAAEVKVLNNARDQLEAVVGTLLAGVEEALRSLPDHKGQNLNISA